MKNCDEMVNSLLERREQYITEQKRKRKILARTITSMCCVCLAALLGLSVWQGGRFNSPPAHTVNDAIYPGTADTFDESKSESADNPADNNKIIVRQIESISSDTDRNLFALLFDDFVVMNKAELNEYYGINVFPTVPDDIKEWENQRFGIYRRNGGTGEVYWDGTTYNYSNEDFSRALNIGIKKNSLPFCDYALLEAPEEKSIINNVEIAIAQSDNGYFYAQFMYHNVGFQLTANGLTLDEFVAVISSLIK